MMGRRLFASSALLLAVLLGLAGCSSGKDFTADNSFTFVSPGGKLEFSYPTADRKPIGELAGPDLTGTKTLKVSDYRGKVVVINFWGSWCPPCVLEASGFEAAAQTLAGRGVQFLGINVKDGTGAGAAFNASHGITYPSIYDPALRTMLSIRGFPATYIPSTIVLDRSGRVAHIWLTDVTRAQLLDTVAPLAAES